MKRNVPAAMLGCSLSTLLLAGAGGALATDKVDLTPIEELGKKIFFDETLSIEKNQACRKAALAGDRLTAGLNKIIDRLDLPFVAYNQASICHLETSATMFVPFSLLGIRTFLKEVKTRKHMMEEMGAAFMAEGIVTLAGSRMYTSMADTDEVIDDALARFERVLEKIGP